MASNDIVTSVDLEQHGIKKTASGKVREIFEIDTETLLFVATDRISAHDVILSNGIPRKGELLTQLSAHWFGLIKDQLPSLKTHLITTDLPSNIPDSVKSSLVNRSMQVRKYPIVPLESIVRGYITGSAWAEYKSKGTVHGVPMPTGLQESQKLERPIWTPSTKAEAGQHDENISKDRAAELVDADVAKKIEEVSLQIYQLAHDFAEQRGILIADTKFEFGLVPSTKEIVLVDEVLTPDSSRFWPADDYQVGRSQQSYDKQYLRDWLTTTGNKSKEGVEIPPEIVHQTSKKYEAAYDKLTRT